MSRQATVYLGMALVIAVLIIVAIVVSRIRLRRAVRALVKAFRAQGATSPGKGTTLEKLGFAPRNPFEGMLRARDIRPEALRMLQQAKVVRSTESGTLYLSEEELDRSPLKAFAKIK